MKPTFICLGMLMLPLAAQELAIRDVPKIIDSGFLKRYKLCPGAPYEDGVGPGNDERRSVEQLLGPITAIDVHQFGPKYTNFKDVENYLRGVLAKRPRTAHRFQAWANMTPLFPEGVLGRLRFANGSTGAFEATSAYVCAQDASGVYWWFRLVPMDIWPGQD
jgi:hypothetical protein